MSPHDAPSAVSHYRVVRKLGEGGMGVVYAAVDDRLNRHVAIKMMRDEALRDGSAVDRFWREARTAARLSHPNICQIHELGEHEGRPFLVMELLEGESLGERLASGRSDLDEALRIMDSILLALDSIHAQGLVHRDLKPSNVFLSSHGVKLLDFGLARSVASPDSDTQQALTLTGVLVGTPQYMAPEQALGEALSPAVDIFGAGLILFELLAGRPAFGGDSVMSVLHAVLHEAPPALLGSPAVVAIDRIVHRALSKRPVDRYSSAREMALELASAAALDRGTGPARAVPMTRVAVLPFRLLRDDSDLQFLTLGLPDAIVTSLSRLEALVVRSSLQSSRFAGESPDLLLIARELAVDVVVTGTILGAGDQLRVSAQLLSAPGGEVVWSDAWTAPRTELFALQDSAAARIARALPVTRGEPTPPPQHRPASARAYELYLQANQLSYEPTMWRRSADLYEQCVEEDPDFAPAWARLGRLYRVFAKYNIGDPITSLQKAEAAFGRALTLSPDLALAHQLYAQHEVEMGRAEDALRRLLQRAAGRRPDPDLLAGLVHACRYVDLLDASCAAHDIAKRLDPNAQTSVLHTWFLMGRYEMIAAEQHRSTDPVVGIALAAMGRRDEALAVFKAEEERFAVRPTLREFATAAAAALEGRQEDARALAHFDQPWFRDGEGMYYFARILSFARGGDAALGTLERAVDLGFGSSVALHTDPWLEPIRSDPRFAELDARCRARHARGKQVFIEHGGETLLGIRAG